MSTRTTEQVQERYARSLMNTFGTPRLVLSRGEGAYVWDADGNRYLDLLAGIAVNALGHAHPALVRAVTEQLGTLGHVSNFFATEPQVTLAERLLALLGVSTGSTTDATGSTSDVTGSTIDVTGSTTDATGSTTGGKVFFTNSGTEANEAAFKLTRRTGRTHIVSTEGSFHGRTMGALAVTSKQAYREPFEPLPGDVTFVPYGDADALAESVTDRTAAVVVEPLQGEAGVVVPPDGYLRAARDVTSEHGALLWVDEVQTGMGRTGAWFAHTAAGITPDVVTLAKGLAGGIPIGACVAMGESGTLLRPGNHGTTFGGNPVAAAAALAVIETIEKDDLLANADTVGDALRKGLVDERVTEVRGRGLLIGLDLDRPVAAEVVDAAQQRGFIINACSPDRIRLAPPLVLTEKQAARFTDAWPGVLDSAYAKAAETEAT